MKRHFLTLFLVILSGLFGYYIGTTNVTVAWSEYKPSFSIKSKQPPPSLQNVDLSLFWEVWQKLENSYYDKTALDGQKMLNGAISGMVAGIGDPYTVFLPPVQNEDFKDGLAGRFEGIGAELGMKNKQIIVVAPLDGSPAQKAGIRAGDALFEVDGKSIGGWTLNQTVEKIRGPKGTQVVLTVLHKGEDKTAEIKIQRDTITVKSVFGWLKKPSEIDSINKDNPVFKKNPNAYVAYLRLSQFGDTANKDWVSVVNDLTLEMGKKEKAKGVIVDLRNNPGGYLTEAQFIAGEFLPEQTPVVSQDSGKEKITLYVNRNGLLKDIPVIVLINKGSASASEIVSGALRDHKKAQLVGETSFGKGTIQTAEDFGNGAGIHITVAKWLTPNDTWVHEKGLKPDFEVELDKKDPSRDTQLEKAVEVLLGK